MKYTEYLRPQDFLEIVQPQLKEHEALYGLMLGLTLGLEKDLYRYGARAPLFATLFPGENPPLAILMTPPHKLQIAAFGPVPKGALEHLAQELYQRDWSVPAVMSEATVAREFSRYWQDLTSSVTQTGMEQNIFELRQVENVPLSPGTLRLAGEGDLEVAREYGRGFYRDCFPEKDPEEGVPIIESMIEEQTCYTWEDDGQVTTILALRRPTPHGITVSYVYTPPEMRGRGYATSAVAALSRQCLDRGYQFCTLYTDAANPTSNRIYQKIGYRKVGEVVDIHFKP